MKTLLPISFLLFFISFSQAQTPTTKSQRFDEGWRFHRGGADRAEQPGFNDSSWRQIDLPHDWSIEDLPGTASPFSRDAVTQVSGGFTTGGTGWYRKTFVIPSAEKPNQVHMLFEGVYMNADIYLNGQHLANHPYGYTSFWVDLTGKIKYGQKNVLAVQVKNEGMNSRWYSGSGIYRHVWLKIFPPVHIDEWGQFITTPIVNAQQATIEAETKIINEGKQAVAVTINTKIISHTGEEVAHRSSTQQVPAGGVSVFSQFIQLKNPQLWSTTKPLLYKAVSEVSENGNLRERQQTVFGIRTISFDVKNGFRLNGEPLKLKGGCFHNDNGPLGSRSYDRAEERRVQLLKESGYNAIRCSHNPPAPAFLNACDSLGLLVMDEAFDMWRIGKNPYDYHLYFDNWWKRDIESMVVRDRNHPSIIMWSIGNEIPERGNAEGVRTANMLASFLRQLDTTRPVTSAVNGLNEDKDPYFAALDIAGYNYAYGGDHLQKDIYEKDHTRLPERIIVGTESYPLEAFGSWMDVIDHPYVIGDFVWTAFDYIGEASIGWRGYWQEQNFFPWNLAYCGDIDICGWKRPQSYYRDALWKPAQVSIFVEPPQPYFPQNPNRQSWSKWHWFDVVADWNWKGYENKALKVDVYSSCPEVELYLNGKSIGRKRTNRSTKFTAVFQVPYQAGVLKAIGYDGKNQVQVSELRTAEEPVTISLLPDRNEIRADGQDLSYVTVELRDGKGVRNPRAENLLTFEISGPGTIAAVANGNPVSIESYQRPERKAWQGRCMLIITSSKQAGEITIKAKSGSMAPAEIKINSR